MKAATRSKYGNHEVISVTEVPVAEPAEDEVFIKVLAATVNRTDCGLLSASPWILRMFTGLFKPSSPFIGTDFAGIIEAVGNKVTNFKMGDKVFGFDDSGIASQSQYMKRKATKPMAIIPEAISFEEAAAASEGAHYAINFINKVNIRPDHRILVNGATGAIGLACLQLLKAQEIYVVAVCGTENIEKVKSMGADSVMDYKQVDFTKEDEKYDFVFDCVGKNRFKNCKRILRKGGAYISSELGPNGENIFLPLSTKLFSNKKVKFPIPLNVQGSLDYITPLLAERKFKPLIDRSYGLDQIREAYKYVCSGQKVGNVIIHPWEVE